MFALFSETFPKLALNPWLKRPYCFSRNGTIGITPIWLIKTKVLKSLNLLLFFSLNKDCILIPGITWGGVEGMGVCSMHGILVTQRT